MMYLWLERSLSHYMKLKNLRSFVAGNTGAEDVIFVKSLIYADTLLASMIDS